MLIPRLEASDSTRRTAWTVSRWLTSQADFHSLKAIDDASMSYRCTKMTGNVSATSIDIDVHALVFELTSMTET